MLVVMRDHELYATILGLRDPWSVTGVNLDAKSEEVTVHVEAVDVSRLPCPECGELSKRYDHRERRWRHLDTCQYRTILVARVPRIECTEHGVRQVEVPWGEPGSHFTALFEALAIDWLREASLSAVSRRLRLSWDQIDGIMQRAVERGLARRAPSKLTRIGIDETSFQKGHEYVTVVTDLVGGDVVYVADDRKKESLEAFFDELEPAEIVAIEAICMDMWKPYIAVVEENVYKAEEKICFDKFHVAKHLGDAVNKVRHREHRHLMDDGDRTLVGSKHTWLQNPENMSTDAARMLRRLKGLALKTARAWALKEHAMCLWSYGRAGWAMKAWKAWIAWALRSRLGPMKSVAYMVREHLVGIVNAIVLGATNAGAESINAKIQRIKRMACGFRNRGRFRTAIYFHLGGLDLLPATHTKP